MTRGECKNVDVKHKTCLNVLFTVCDGPIKTRLTPVKVVPIGVIDQPADIRAGCFHTLGDELLYIFMKHQDLKVAPFLSRPAHNHGDSRSFPSLSEIAITLLLCQWRILSFWTRMRLKCCQPVWSWLQWHSLPEQFSFYSTKLPWNKWTQAQNYNQVGHICRDLQMFLLNILFMLQLAIQSNDIPANILCILFFFFSCLASQKDFTINIWSYSKIWRINVD